MDDLFIDIQSAQKNKKNQAICGDAIHNVRIAEQSRFVSVLSDGLGSGVKANILANMTARMAAKFVLSDMDFVHSAAIMMDALPVCQVRNISYATFTIWDLYTNGTARILEMDNPETLLFRHAKPEDTLREVLHSTCREGEIARDLKSFTTTLKAGDRLISMSDGVSQSGLGTAGFPLGWQAADYTAFIADILATQPGIPSRYLARKVVDEAARHEAGGKPGDDISCTVAYVRNMRRLLVVTGPPYHKDKDEYYADQLLDYAGRTAICGGTSSTIVERELGLMCEFDNSTRDAKIPMACIMDGVDLVTEGIITLTRAAEYLENGVPEKATDAAAKLVNLMLDCDHIDFLVGTQLNTAHHDPDLAQDYDIRRNVVKKIAKKLENNHLKETAIDYI